ncbi:MAG: ABC transporter permease [Pseudomonadales bacterium]
MFSQILAISMMNLRNIRSRLGTSSVIVIGIGGVVAVFVGILALANGFQSALASAGKEERAIVMRGGATSEMNGAITREQRNIISKLPGIDAVSGEIYSVIDVNKKATGTPANLVLRGLDSAGFDIRTEVEVVEGRRFGEGKQEVIVGVGANMLFENIAVGDALKVRGGEWQVVGLFSAEATAYEGEVWGDANVVGNALGRSGVVSTLRVGLAPSADIEAINAQMTSDPRLDHLLRTEAEYYASQSESLNGLISGFGYLVATIMAIGAVFAALNTMYSAVSTRTVEIATLRALGFGSGPVVVSVMLEALALALIGGLLGAGIVYFGVDGYTSSTLNSASFSQVVFDYEVSGRLIVQGLAWALVLGLFGGLFPAVRAARLPITTALRGD